MQRALSFAKYLPAHDYEVHVLTAGNAATPVLDPGLLKHIPPQVKVHRCFTPEIPFYMRKKIWSLLASSTPSEESHTPNAKSLKSSLASSVKNLLSPDPQVVWVPFAIRNARRIIREFAIDYVLVTAPPFSTFLTGIALKKACPQVKLISDFRDEWLRFYLTEFAFLSGGSTLQRAQAIERETVELSDLVLAVTETSLGEIRGRYPEQPDVKFAVIPNGYDPEVFAGFEPRSHDSGKLVVTHAGTVYRSASPHYYLDALDSLPAEVRSHFETRFMGRIADEELAGLRNRRSDVKTLGNLPQAQAVKNMEETDYLLLTMTNDYSVPGKLLEYLATGKRILAFSPMQGEVAKILRETRAGWCAAPDDPEGIRRMLLEAHAAWQSGIPPATDWARVRAYERPRLAAQLASVLEERLATRPVPVGAASGS